MNDEVAIRPQTAIEGELSVAQVLAQVQKIQDLMRSGMKDNEHFGIIPGTNNKPTLLKPGAEKLCLMFRLAPEYDSGERYDGDHLTIKSKCVLTHIPTGRRLGSGEGSCSTKEVKYAYRQASRKCPTCGKEAIIRGKKEYGGGWLCFKRKDGCGAKFKDGDATIEGQQVGRIPNEDLADQYNTILKMANKRSLIAAVLNVTAASDIFTQDLEDQEETAPAAPPPPAKEEPGSPPNPANPGAAGASDTETPVQYWKRNILEAKTTDDLKALWKGFAKEGGRLYDFTEAEQKELEAAKDRRKKELSGAQT